LGRHPQQSGSRASQRLEREEEVEHETLIDRGKVDNRLGGGGKEPELSHIGQSLKEESAKNVKSDRTKNKGGKKKGGWEHSPERKNGGGQY